MDDKLAPEEEELWVLTQEFYTALDKLIRGMQLYQGKGGLGRTLVGGTHETCRQAFVSSRLNCED